MKKSFISPSLQINDLNDLNNENFIKSPAPVASQALNSDEYIDNNETEWDEIDEEGRDSDNDEEQYIDKENDSYATSIKNKDLRIFKMKFILEEKKKQMFEKEQEVKELQKYNSFLESVITDYENYNRSILEEKNKQKTAIKILSDHIRDISKEMKTDDYKLNRVKSDQRILLDELQNIRNELREALALNGRENEYISSDEDEYN
jgi:chromosome segregation ATPase